MDKKKIDQLQAEELRRQAEESLKLETSLPEEISPAEAKKLIYELRVHQIELEMQNEELRRAQEILEESRRRYSDLYDFAPVGYLTLDELGIVKEANLTAAGQLVTARRRLIGRHFTSFLSTKAREAFRRHLQLVLQDQGPQTCELSLKGADREESFVSLRSVFHLDAEGGRLCRTAVSDITERRQAETALKESEERYRSLFNYNHAVMLLIDPATGAIVDANPAACAYYAYTHAELISRNITDINLLPRDQVFKEMQRAMSLQCRQFFFRHRLAGGDVRHVEVFSGPIRLQGRDLLYSIIHDITARQQAEEALQRTHDDLEERVRERTEDLRQTVEQLEWEIDERRQTEEALARQVTLVQDLYNNAPCGYHSLDPEGTFVQINDTELAWLGYAREEVLGRMKFSDIVTADSLKVHQQVFPEFKARGWVRDVEYELIRRDGTVMPVSLSATAIKDKAGHFLMSRSTVFDITERKRTEEAIRQSELRLRHLTAQLLTAQEEERHRISLALHDDLGQSLMVLKLQLRGVEKNLPPGPGVAKSRDECSVALDYLDTTIKNIRRISQNLRPAILENFGLGSALQSLVNEFCQRQELKCSFELDDLGQTFPTETEIVIYRIFQEMLTNIGKHAQASQVDIVVKKRQDHVHFSINDNGSGFDVKEVLAGTANTGGMGLGSIEERVRMLDGTLQLWSEVGQGTRISFTVPLHYQ